MKTPLLITILTFIATLLFGCSPECDSGQLHHSWGKWEPMGFRADGTPALWRRCSACGWGMWNESKLMTSAPRDLVFSVDSLNKRTWDLERDIWKLTNQIHLDRSLDSNVVDDLNKFSEVLAMVLKERTETILMMNQMKETISLLTKTQRVTTASISELGARVSNLEGGDVTVSKAEYHDSFGGKLTVATNAQLVGIPIGSTVTNVATVNDLLNVDPLASAQWAVHISGSGRSYIYEDVDGGRWSFFPAPQPESKRRWEKMGDKLVEVDVPVTIGKRK